MLSQILLLKYAKSNTIVKICKSNTIVKICIVKYYRLNM